MKKTKNCQQTAYLAEYYFNSLREVFNFYLHLSGLIENRIWIALHDRYFIHKMMQRVGPGIQ